MTEIKMITSKSVDEYWVMELPTQQRNFALPSKGPVSEASTKQLHKLKPNWLNIFTYVDVAQEKELPPPHPTNRPFRET